MGFMSCRVELWILDGQALNEPWPKDRMQCTSGWDMDAERGIAGFVFRRSSSDLGRQQHMCRR